jgi:hypothetical protein
MRSLSLLLFGQQFMPLCFFLLRLSSQPFAAGYLALILSTKAYQEAVATCSWSVGVLSGGSPVCLGDGEASFGTISFIV